MREFVSNTEIVNQMANISGPAFDKKTKNIIIGTLIVLGVGVAVALYFTYKNGSSYLAYSPPKE